MKKLFDAAPGVIWVAIISGLVLLAEWATTNFGGVSWVPPVVGLVVTVVVPILKILHPAAEEPPAAWDEPQVESRSTLSRYLL